MRFSKPASAAVVGVLALVSIELFVEALLRGFSRPAMLVVLGVLAVSVLVVSALATYRSGPTSTPYW